MKAKEFLGERRVDHRSVNAHDDGPGAALHADLGAPPVPSIVVDGRPFPLLHVSQLATVLGLELGDSSGTKVAGMSYDCVAILESWLDALDRMDLEAMTAPTRVRGRSVRSLTVEMFHLFSLLPAAWEDGALEWHTKETNQVREAPLTDAASVRAFAHDRLATFQMFLLDHEDEFEQHDPWVVTSARGEATFSVLMESQLTHAGVHHRQLVDFLDERGIPIRGLLQVDGIAGLELPEAIY